MSLSFCIKKVRKNYCCADVLLFVDLQKIVEYQPRKAIEDEQYDEDPEEAHIQVLCDVARDFAPEYDERKILAAVMQMESV